MLELLDLTWRAIQATLRLYRAILTSSGDVEIDSGTWHENGMGKYYLRHRRRKFLLEALPEGAKQGEAPRLKEVRSLRSFKKTEALVYEKKYFHLEHS